jgi:hypothetical protein
MMETGVDLDSGAEQIPGSLMLYPNYPNPFNAGTSIRYYVPERMAVRLAVYDVKGRRVRILRDAVESAGEKRVTWDGTDDFGRGVSSGIYLARLEGEGKVSVQKLLLQK